MSTMFSLPLLAVNVLDFSFYTFELTFYMDIIKQ